MFPFYLAAWRVALLYWDNYIDAGWIRIHITAVISYYIQGPESFSARQCEWKYPFFVPHNPMIMWHFPCYGAPEVPKSDIYIFFLYIKVIILWDKKNVLFHNITFLCTHDNLLVCIVFSDRSSFHHALDSVAVNKQVIKSNFCVRRGITHYFMTKA